jgi:hypothetical protein
VPTAVAVVGLIVALSFNTIGVWRSVQESEQTRRATEVNLLTQLDAFVNQAEQELNATEDLDTRCNGNRVYSLSDGDNARLFAALQYYDYMAAAVQRGAHHHGARQELLGAEHAGHLPRRNHLPTPKGDQRALRRACRVPADGGRGIMAARSLPWGCGCGAPRLGVSGAARA